MQMHRETLGHNGSRYCSSHLEPWLANTSQGILISVAEARSALVMQTGSLRHTLFVPSQDWLHHLQGPMQNENTGPLV